MPLLDLACPPMPSSRVGNTVDPLRASPMIWSRLGLWTFTSLDFLVLYEPAPVRKLEVPMECPSPGFLIPVTTLMSCFSASSGLRICGSSWSAPGFLCSIHSLGFTPFGMKNVANLTGLPSAPMAPAVPVVEVWATALPMGEMDSRNGSAMVTPTPRRNPLRDRCDWLRLII